MRYAVGYMDFFDNNLQVRVVDDATTWKDAWVKAFPEQTDNHLPDDIEEAKEYAFNRDWLFDVVEITSL